MTHDELVIRGEAWLKNQAGCSVVLRDPMRCANQEQPDAIGWRDHVSILIEVKVSRSDFLADAKKQFRAEPERGMGDWRLLLCPSGLIAPEDLPDGWGLLWATDRQIRRVAGLPRGNMWGPHPMTGNKRAETMLLKSALRRVAIRGLLDVVYDQPWKQEAPAGREVVDG